MNFGYQIRSTCQRMILIIRYLTLGVLLNFSKLLDFLNSRMGIIIFTLHTGINKIQLDHIHNIIVQKGHIVNKRQQILKLVILGAGIQQ